MFLNLVTASFDKATTTCQRKCLIVLHAFVILGLTSMCSYFFLRGFLLYSSISLAEAVKYIIVLIEPGKVCNPCEVSRFVDS